jgi:hypothetical protein
LRAGPDDLSEPSAKPERTESFNCEQTGRVVQAILGAGAEAAYRIGRSWSVAPPDFDTS